MQTRPACIGVREPATPRLPPRAGVGLKNEHFRDIEESAPHVGFFEVHAENFMGAGGPPHARLTRLRRDYPLSIHGVGLSIGGEQALDHEHLCRVKALIERYEPAVFSEHLAWSTHDTCFLNDLLPLPYNEMTLKRVAAHMDKIQEALGRPILLENPATYLRFKSSLYSEIEFLHEVVRRTDCGLLLDVNNAYVCALNHAFVAEEYIDAFPMRHVKEIHLAGYAEDADKAGGRLLIDAHCAPVSETVWRLYERALSRCGPVATLIEWDNDVPTWPILMAEATRAESFLEKRRTAEQDNSQSEAPHAAVA